VHTVQVMAPTIRDSYVCHRLRVERHECSSSHTRGRQLGYSVAIAKRASTGSGKSMYSGKPRINWKWRKLASMGFSAAGQGNNDSAVTKEI
jgi:hypothetical protein